MFSLRSTALAASLLATLGGAAPAQALQLVDPPVQVTVYSAFTEIPGAGIIFTDPLGQQAAYGIHFGLDASWWPAGEQQAFGALVTSGLQAGSAGSYTLTLGSDDAAYLFIDQQLVLARPGPNAYGTQQVTVALAAGYHALEVQFYNSYCCGSALTLDAGGLQYVAAAPVPEPTSLALWLGGLAVTGWAARRRWAQPA